jgi:hypothetical protein
MNLFFLIFISFLNCFRTYSSEEIKLSFSPKEFCVGTNGKVFCLKTFPTLFSSVNFRKCLGGDFYGKIQEAAIMRTYSPPLEKNGTKVCELNKKKSALEKKFPLLLLHAENNQSPSNPFIKKPGFLNKIDLTLSSLPTAQKFINVSEALVQNYNSSIGTNFKIMAQEFTMHNLLFKATLGGSIISTIVLIAKDIILVEKLRKSTSKVILFLIAANFVIFHWRKFYYGVEYVRHAMNEKKYTKSFLDFLEKHEEKILFVLKCVEISFLLILLYKNKNDISNLVLRFKNETLSSLIKENLPLLNERKLNSAMVVGIFPFIFFQKKLLNLIFLLSKKIEEYLISGFKISNNKQEIYNSVDGFFAYIETVLYQDNPQIAESDFDSLVLKIKQNIENQKEVLKKSERIDAQDIQEIEQILKCFAFSVINDVTSDGIKVYDFKKRIDDFILVQKLLLLCKICLHESLFDTINTIKLKNENGQEINKNDLLFKIHELCESLAKEENTEEKRKVISQMIVSLFELIKKNKEKINENQDNFWYVEELIDTDFKKQYPHCFDHINNGRKTFFNQCREVFNIKKLRDGLGEDINRFWLFNKSGS